MIIVIDCVVLHLLSYLNTICFFFNKINEKLDGHMYNGAYE